MAEREQSPLGKVVRAHRVRLGITQQELVDRLNRRSDSDGGFTLRTIQEWERHYPPGINWRIPHRANLRSLASALDIAPNSPEWEELLRAAQSRRIVATAPPIAAPIVANDPEGFIGAGRERHLQHLQRTIDTAANGQPGIAFIGADLGTGKTWLTAQAARDALQRHTGLVVLWGESPIHADPHHAIRQILLQMIGEPGPADVRYLTDETNQQRRLGRLAHAIETILTYRQGLVDRFIPLGQLASLADTPQLTPDLRQQIADVVAGGYPGPGALGPSELISRVMATYAERPTLVVLEDIHWADVGTAAILHQIISDVAGTQVPLAIVCTYRSAELGTDDAAASAMASVMREANRLLPITQVDLADAVGGNNGRAFVDAFVAAYVSGAPPELNDSLFDSTAGLPLLVSRLVRWYRDEGALHETESGSNQLSWHHQPRPLPGDVTDVIQSLLDRVPSDLRRILDLAAVQGTTFSAEIIQDILRLSPTELIRLLDTHLDSRHRLITATEVSTTAGSRSHDYAFVHALFRDELYRRLSLFERDHLHRETAAAMARRWGDTPHDGCARIALHYRLAGDLAQAGTWALRGGDYWLDRHHYAPARELYIDVQSYDLRLKAPMLTAQSLVGLGNCDRGEGNNTAARQHFIHAQEIARRERLPLVQANALTSEAMLDFDAGQMQRGAELLTHAVDVLTEFGDFSEACRSLTLLSHALHGAGRYAEAAERAKDAIELAVSLPNEPLEAGAHIALGNCLLDMGLYDDAIAQYEKCLDICLRHQSMHRAVICWLNISLCSFEQGAWQRGRQNLDLVFEQKSSANPRLIGAAHFNRAVIAELTGDLDAAQADYDASLTIRMAFDQHALQIDSRAGLVRIAQQHGNMSVMSAELSLIESHLDRCGLDGIEHPGRLHLTLVDAYGVLGQPDLRQKALQRGLAMLDERAALLGDAEAKRVYLTDVPCHRALRERARHLQRQPARASLPQQGNARAGSGTIPCRGDLD